MRERPPTSRAPSQPEFQVNFATEHLDKACAAGDIFGRIRLFKYPVQSSYAIGRTYQAQGGERSFV
jgi:hypothetical protein